MIGLNLLLCAASLVLPREFLTESWGKAHDGGEIRQTPEGRVFAAPRPKAGVSGEFAVGADWGVVELSCEYRAKDVVPGEKFYENGRILQEFVGVGGKRVGAWPATLGVTGTTDGWRPWSARYRVPDGAKRYKVNFSNIAKSGSVEYRKASLRLVKSRADLAPHDEPLPPGFSSDPFALDDAWRVAAGPRTRICLNGLWRARPVATNDVPDRIPADGDCWGWAKIPGVWRRGKAEQSAQVEWLSDWFAENRVGLVAEARWYRRKLTVPPEASGRRVVLTFTLVNSRAVVYVDGREAGRVSFPGGAADITAAVRPGVEHDLALYVTAWPCDWEKGTCDGPLTEKLARTTDHAVKKSVDRAGVTGDLYLDLLPQQPFIDEAYAECDVARRQVTFVAKTAKAVPADWSLVAAVEGCGAVRTFEGKGARFTADWPEAKLWSTATPTNLYTCRLTLRDAAGRTVDAALPFRFGFRDVRTKGRELLLNGETIHLRGLFNNSWTGDAAISCREACRELCRRLKADGVNFVIAGNYAVQPGQITYLDAFLEACDEEGVLFSVTLPHVREFDWAIGKDPAKRARFAQLTEWMISRVRNHPSVILYAMTHNRVGYPGDINPERMDGTYAFPAGGKADGMLRRQKIALDGEAIAKAIDPTRPVYHHEGGNLGDFHCCNIYLNWAPVQERSEWIRNWAEKGTKPLVFVEWGLPHVASWSSYRGPLFIWTRPAFQSAWAAEYAAAFRGDAAFEANEPNRRLIDAEERAWARGEPFYFGRELLPALREWRSNVQQIQALCLARNLPDFRAWGLTEFLPWDQGGFYDRVRNRPPRDNPQKYAGLKVPGIVPDQFPQQSQYWYDTGARDDFALTEVGAAWRDGFRPSLAFIGGGDVFTDRRHGYRVGETVAKSLVLVNDTQAPQKVVWSCAFGSECRTGKTVVASGRTAFVPVAFAATTLGAVELTADFRFPDGKTTRDAFVVDVWAQPAQGPTNAVGEVCLYDPKGLTAENFRRLGIPFKPVGSSVAVGDGAGETFVYESGRGADTVPVTEGVKLVIGRECLTPSVMNRLVMPALRARGRLLVFEQTREALEAVGFRVQEYGLRTAFPRYRDSRVTSAADAARLHDWAGEATLIGPHLDGLDAAELSFPRQMANGFHNWHVWRCGCRGNVASVLIEKPSVGDWRARVDGGFNLQYAPLLEWVTERGVATFCQLDVTARTVAEPAADDVVRELVAALDRTEPYRPHVQALGREAILAVRDGGIDANPDPLVAWGGKGVLVASSGAKKPEDFAARVAKGGVALCLGFTAEEVKVWSPVPLAVEERVHAHSERIARIPPELNGLSNADWSWHGTVDLAAFADEDACGNCSFRIVRHGKGKIIFWQVPPWKLDDRAKPYLRVSRRRAEAMFARLLHNLGATSSVAGIHYLDAPVAEDDPYRYIRW